MLDRHACWSDLVSDRHRCRWTALSLRLSGRPIRVRSLLVIREKINENRILQEAMPA
jgi:hypothetical protein